MLNKLGQAGSSDGNTDAEAVCLGNALAASPEQVHPGSRDGAWLKNRYRLLSPIGQTRAIRVYKAWDSYSKNGLTRSSPVIVKIWEPNADRAYTAAAGQIKHIERLLHPNIARFLDSGIDGGRFFVVVEYVRGDSLNLRLLTEMPRLLYDQKLRIMEEIADALTFAHEHGIVHGDLRPANIRLTEANEVKLIDFVIPGLVSPSNPITLTPYSSPERRSQSKAEPVDDVYALACITYELFTGKHPASDQITRGTGFPPPPTPELSSKQYAVIARGLDPDRARRTSTVTQFRLEWTSATGSRSNRSIGVWLMIAAIAFAVLIYAITHRSRSLHIESARPSLTRIIAPTPTMPPSGTAIRDCEVCPPVVVLPPGQFMQGSRIDDPIASSVEKPGHLVSLRQSFAIADETVTVQQYEAFVNATGRSTEGCEIYDDEWRMSARANWRQPGFNQTALHPVVCVSWNDSVAYAEWLSKTTGYRYRLPSAAEWEYAARGTSAAATAGRLDAAQACTVANVADASASRRYPGWNVFDCDDGFVSTSPVNHFIANGYGLHDMLGNVLTWTLDCWHANYIGAPSDGSPRVQADCMEHELRGASWFSAPAIARASYRNHFAADYRGSSVGMRVVRELTP